jgi:glycosyltransferase involved in cell wall biosynthesis
MRFVFLSTMQDWQWGGSEELWSQAATRLRRAGDDVQASVPYWPQKLDKLRTLEQQKIRVHTHASSHAGQARRIWNKLSRNSRRAYSRLKREKPDLVVISQGHNSGGFDWARACREASIPYVVIVHCNSELWWFQEEIDEAVASYTAARRVFCVSQGNLNLLRLQLGEPLPNAEVVRNPCNVSPASMPGWPDESKGWRMACVARLDPAAKGQDLLLQLLARPEWREQPVELNLFGSGPGESTLRRMASLLQLNNVHFHGHVSDIAAIWEHNHLLVLPSRYEGLPLALVEAMWCGRPSVVTDVGGNAELCIDNETGFVAAAATVSSVSEALHRAWEQRKDWPRFGQVARNRIAGQMPEDPVAVFCDRLRACAAKESSTACLGHDGSM